MKNNITAAEWLALNENLQLGSIAAMEKWEREGKLDENMKLLNSAEDKVKQVANTIQERGMRL